MTPEEFQEAASEGVALRDEAFSQGYAEGYEDGYEDGEAGCMNEVSQAYDEGYLDGREDRSLEQLLLQAISKAGFDFLEGCAVRWDGAERRVVFSSLDEEG